MNPNEGVSIEGKDLSSPENGEVYPSPLSEVVNAGESLLGDTVTKEQVINYFKATAASCVKRAASRENLSDSENSGQDGRFERVIIDDLKKTSQRFNFWASELENSDSDLVDATRTETRNAIYEHLNSLADMFEKSGHPETSGLRKISFGN